MTRVDINALCTKARREGRVIGAAINNSLKSDYVNSLKDMGNFSIISASANGKKG